MGRGSQVPHDSLPTYLPARGPENRGLEFDSGLQRVVVVVVVVPVVCLCHPFPAGQVPRQLAVAGAAGVVLVSPFLLSLVLPAEEESFVSCFCFSQIASGLFLNSWLGSLEMLALRILFFSPPFWQSNEPSMKLWFADLCM